MCATGSFVSGDEIESALEEDSYGIALEEQQAEPEEIHESPQTKSRKHHRKKKKGPKKFESLDYFVYQIHVHIY